MCIIDIAKEYLCKQLDAMDIIINSISKGYVTFNFENYNDSDNFYVRQPHKILEMITGKKWECTKESADYVVKDNEYAVEFWSINGSTGHFARTKKGFNSLQSSNNVKNGKIISYRVFREVK